MTQRLYRIVNSNGDQPDTYNNIKGYYPVLTSAKRALQFGGRGAKIQQADVEWEELDAGTPDLLR